MSQNESVFIQKVSCYGRQRGTPLLFQFAGTGVSRISPYCIAISMGSLLAVLKKGWKYFPSVHSKSSHLTNTLFILS